MHLLRIITFNQSRKLLANNSSKAVLVLYINVSEMRHVMDFVRLEVAVY